MRKSMNWRVPLFKFHWYNEDIENLINIINTGVDWTVGVKVSEFEAAV